MIMSTLSYFVDISFNRRNPELKKTMSIVMMILHKALGDIKKDFVNDVAAIDFPEYKDGTVDSKGKKKKLTIGTKIRFFSSKEVLDSINLFARIKSNKDLKGKVFVKPAEQIPSEVKGFASLTRGITNTNSYKRRMIKRCQDEVKRALLESEMRIEGVKLPKIKLVSSSSVESFEVYVKRRFVSANYFKGKQNEFEYKPEHFSTYGLSKNTYPVYIPVF